MQTKTKINNSDGSTTSITYEDVDSFDLFDINKIKQVYAVCFLNDKIIIVFHGIRKTWSLVGGSIEPGESLEDCLRREIQEESNMKVLGFKPVGYQMIQTGDTIFYQLRYVCIVEPYGDFVSDPAGKITEVRLIDPREYKTFFDWGEIGERIITRALETVGTIKS